MKKRVLIIGSTGIISTNLQIKLDKENLKYSVIGRREINLKSSKSFKYLSKRVNKDDIVVFISAEAPAKNTEMFINNIKMCENVCKALKGKKINKLIYISSDAVYSDSPKRINEKSETLPNSIHGMMHLTREIILKINIKNKLCILRPTLIYGNGDTHGGYGPNKFTISKK